MLKRSILIVLCSMAATVAIAHTGVKNPAVKARMDGMAVIAAQTKLFGEMAKGARPFDATAAQAAAKIMATEAAQIKVLFATREDDPKSEARDEIWSNYSDFSAKADTLVTAAELASKTTSLDDLRLALAAIGTTCKDCHSSYRE